jgi:hypothetical protein
MENENKIKAILLKMKEFEKRALQAKSNRTGIPMSVLLRREGLSGLEIEQYDILVLDLKSNKEFLKVSHLDQIEYESILKSIGKTLYTDANQPRIIQSITLTSKESESKKTISGGRSKTLNTILGKLEKFDKFQERKKLLENANKI